MNAKILKLDVGGRPIAWITREAGALHYCRDQLRQCDLTRDHVVPVSRGGTDTWGNVVTACRGCNQRKADLSLDECEAIGMRLLAVPFVPIRAEGLILANREILADQMDFLRRCLRPRLRRQRARHHEDRRRAEHNSLDDERMGWHLEREREAKHGNHRCKAYPLGPPTDGTVLPPVRDQWAEGLVLHEPVVQAGR